MSDSVNYSFNISTSSQPPSEPVDTDLVAFTDSEIIRANPKMTLVINRDNGAQQVVAPPVVDGLYGCGAFQTIDVHAKNLAQSRPELGGNVAQAKQALAQLKQSGMLLNASSITARFAASEKLPLAESKVFIITCDRPAAVDRLLESMLEIQNLSTHQSFYLIDDSRDPENQRANENLAHKFSTRAAKKLHYFGREQQAALINHLKSQLPEYSSGIDFLLSSEHWQGYATYGVARNFTLLLSAGFRAVVLDDDVICKAVKPIIEEQGLAFTSSAHKAAFFPDDASVQALMEPTGFDPLTGHLQALGQSLGTAINTLTGANLRPQDLAGRDAESIRRLNPNSPVLITQCGSWGDPGLASAHWALNLGPDSVDRLLAAPGGVQKAISDRRMWLGSTKPNLLKVAMMSQVTGLANNHLLPPYFPIFRGEDLIFGAMVEAMYHDGSAIEYSWAVPHLPLQKRNLSMREPIAATGSLTLLVRRLINRLDYNSAICPEQTLAAISLDLKILASRSNKDLIVDYKSELARGLRDQLRQLEGQQARSADVGSDNWKQYIQRGITEVQQAMLAPHEPAEINKEFSSEQILNEFKTQATGFAEALDTWPEIIGLMKDFEI